MHRLSGKWTGKSVWGFTRRGETACLPPVFAVGSKRNVCFIVFLLFFFVGKKVSKPLYDFFSSKAPETVDAAIPMITKTVGVLAVIVAIIVLLIKFL